MLHIFWDPGLGIAIGSFVLRYYSLMFVLSFLCGWYIFDYLVKQDKIDKKYYDSIFIHIFFGVLLGARLGHVLFYQPELFTQDFFSIFLPFQFHPQIRFTGFQGLASHGAIIGVLISLYLFIKKSDFPKSFLWLLDRLIIVTALGCSFVRIGNFMNSEIIGKPFNGSWAVLFVQQSSEYGEIVPRHPSQLYESMFYFLTFCLLLILFFKTNIKTNPGKLFSLGMSSIFTIRLLIEFTKEPQGEEIITAIGLNSGQILSLPIIVSCIYLFFKKTSKSLQNQ